MLADVVDAAADIALRTLGIDAVDVVVGIEECIGIAAWMAVVLIESTKTVVIVQHIVHLQLRRPSFPHTLPLLIAATEVEVGTNVIGKLVLLQRLVVTIAACPERGGDIESSCAIVHVEVVGQRMTVLIDASQIVLKADALALCLLQRDANDGLY